MGRKELAAEKSAVTLARETERGGYKLVTTEELKGWIDKKKAMLVVDTMPYEESYKKQHVPGAVQMEFPIPEMTSLDAAKKAALEKLLGPDKDRLIVFYCGFVKCTRSHNGAMWAVKLGSRTSTATRAGSRPGRKQTIRLNRSSKDLSGGRLRRRAEN